MISRAKLAVPTLLVTLVGVAACGNGSNEPSAGPASPEATLASEAGPGADGSSTSEAPTTPSSSETPTTDSTSSTSSPPDGLEATASVESPSALRERLGARRLVARDGDEVTASSEFGPITVGDDFPAVFADHLFVGEIIDYSNRSVCPGFELVGDFAVIVDVEAVDDDVLVIIEDRRALAIDGTGGTVDLPRWRYDCSTGETIELPSTTTVELEPERFVRTTTSDGGLTLVTELGRGDTPLQLSAQDGTVVIDRSENTFDFVVSADERTVYSTTYTSTAAAAPPDGVVAVDIATGAQRWRHPVGGFVWELGDRVVIEEVTSTLSDLGLFEGGDIVVVDADTGAEIDRFGYSGRLVGLS